MQRPASAIGIELAISSSRPHASELSDLHSIYVQATPLWLGVIRAR